MSPLPHLCPDFRFAPSARRGMRVMLIDPTRSAVFLVPDESRELPKTAGASALAAECSDLCPDRRGAGGRRAAVLAEHLRRAAMAALGGAGAVHRRRRDRFLRRLFGAHVGTA